MTEPNEIKQRVQDIITRVRATSPKDQWIHEVTEALSAMPGVDVVDEIRVRDHEYELELANRSNAEREIEALARVRPFGLSCAPEVVTRLPIDDEGAHFIMIKRYSACPGERLIPAEDWDGELSYRGCMGLLADMRTLAKRGLVQPFTRGMFHWLVSSETGTLVLASGWLRLRHGDADDIRDMHRMVMGRLAARNSDMNRIEHVFATPRVLLPVIHPIGRDQALTAVDVAAEAGVEGVFLINQGMTAAKILELVMDVRQRFPALWVGINLLGVPPAHVLRWGLEECDERLDGIWSDDADIHEDERAQPLAEAFVEARRKLGWAGLYFGGVAFKYQREVPADKLGTAAAKATGYMDVVCTSGPGTGMPADVSKIAAMRAGLPADSWAALAVASGIRAENVRDYLPYANAFLVGTGIEERFGVLDPARVAELHTIISSG